MRMSRCVIGLAFVVACPAVSFAQTSPPLPTTVAAIQTGPVSLYPSIELRDIGIDSNVFNVADEPREDFTFTVNPRVLAAVHVGAARFVGTSAAGFVFYQQYKQEQSVNTVLEGRFDLSATRLRPYLSVGRIRTRDRAGFEIDARALRLETSVAAGVDFDLTSITALTAWARRSDSAYGKGERFLGVDLSGQLDHISELAAAGVKLAVTPLTTIIVAAEVQQDRFTASPLRNADSVRIAPAVEFGTGAAVTGRASAGYRQFKPLDSRLPQYRGFVASTGVGYSLLGVTHVDIEGNRDVMYSFEASEPYYLTFGGRIAVSQRVAGPFDLIVLGQRQRLRYQTLGGVSWQGRLETTTSVGGGVGVHLGEHLSFTVTYDRTRRQSSGPVRRDYDRRRMLGSVTYGL